MTRNTVAARPPLRERLGRTRVLWKACWSSPETITPVTLGGREAQRVDTARHVRLTLEWKAADLYVGAPWKADGSAVHVWLTLIPMVPLHLTWSVPLRYYLSEQGRAFRDAEDVIAAHAETFPATCENCGWEGQIPATPHTCPQCNLGNGQWRS